MNILDEIFTEYVRMRENGLDTKEALRALRAYIEALDMQDKEHLAQQLRMWEKQHASQPDIPASSAPPQDARPQRQKKPSRQAPATSQSMDDKPASLIKPLKAPPQPDSAPETTLRMSPAGLQKNVADDGTTQSTPPYGSQAEDIWVECDNCHAKNRTTEVFCYSCGHLLEGGTASAFDTRHFATATDELYTEEHFGRDSLLVLKVRDTDAQYEIRPQLRNHEVVIGRSSGSKAMRPDIDLAKIEAANFGVSRLHMALRYEDNDNNIVVYDLGSANGSFINGQRLHPKEVRVLRNGDELRLGRLIIRVVYRHPGELI